MNNYLVYHNREKMGRAINSNPSSRELFGIFTRKNVKALIGSNIWIIEGYGYKPRNYCLVERFSVDNIEIGNDGFNYATGKTGARYGTRLILNSLSWFRPFQVRMANFSLGLQKLQLQDVKCFENLSSNLGEKTISQERFVPSGKEPVVSDTKAGGKKLIELIAMEGKEYMAELQRRRRNATLTKKRLAVDKYTCQFCGIRPSQEAINVRIAVVEVHHIYPLKDCNEEIRTSIADLITLCPTCHRVAHAIAKVYHQETLDLKMLRKFYPSILTETAT